MRFSIPEFANPTHEQSRAMLEHIIINLDRSLLRQVLSKFKIPGRTNIHRRLAYWNRDDALVSVAFETILSHSSIHDWISFYFPNSTWATSEYRMNVIEKIIGSNFSIKVEFDNLDKIDKVEEYSTDEPITL